VGDDTLLKPGDQRLIEEDASVLYDEAPCGYLYTRPDGTLLRVNGTFLQWTGYDRGELLGRRFQDLLNVGGRIFHETHFAPLLHMQGSVSEISLDLVTKAGTLLPVLVNSVQKRDAAGRPLLNRTTVFNATDRKRFERELQIARKRAEESARSKSELLSTISHDMRSPLGAILAAAQLLARSPLEAGQQRYVRILKSSSETLLNLVNNVLDLSRIESGRIELERRTFDLREMVLDLLATLNVAAEEKGLALRVHIDDRVPPLVVGDPVKLGQILTNLVSNAVKFTAEGSVAVSIRLRGGAGEKVELEFSVADTGIGIPADQLARVFDEFTQASYDVGATYGGSGLGLAIVRRLVALHGSRVSVESVVERGSIFSFVLTMDVAQAVAGEIEAGANQIANARLLSGLRVLLVEDNSFDRFVLGRTLASWDVTCEVAATLREALTTLKGADIGAVLLNVRLAEGDVAAAASALLNAGSREPGKNAAPAILALLPSTWDKGTIRPGDGILDVVPKPVDPSVLFAKLAAVRP
jgi:PAS domain S-box-containing protein